MTLDPHFNELMAVLLEGHQNRAIPVEQLIHTIDLTLLEEHVSTESLSQLKKSAHQNQVAAVCLSMPNVSAFSSPTGINLATVINFPKGIEDLSASIISLEKAAQMGAVEIDYVFPYQMYLEGQKQKALSYCYSIAQLCTQRKLLLKIIIETGAFPDMQTIYNASKEIIKSGCDFIKTSTGKIHSGASLSAVFAILSAIKESHTNCGIKISGGVKRPNQAITFALLAELMINKPIHKNWFRLGASSLLSELLKIA